MLAPLLYRYPDAEAPQTLHLQSLRNPFNLHLWDIWNVVLRDSKCSDTQLLCKDGRGSAMVKVRLNMDNKKITELFLEIKQTTCHKRKSRSDALIFHSNYLNVHWQNKYDCL